MLQTFFKMLFAFAALGVLSGGAASAQECSGSITAEAIPPTLLARADEVIE